MVRASGAIAFTAGLSFDEDLWLAEPPPTEVPMLPLAAGIALALLLGAGLGRSWHPVRAAPCYQSLGKRKHGFLTT